MANTVKRTLKLTDAISIVAGSMIGSGIFIVSTEMTRLTNSGFWVLICWILSGIMTLTGALCYAELSSSMPGEGGQYIYLKKIFGEKYAFIYGWTLLTVIQTGTLAAVCIAFAKFTGLIFPFFAEDNIIFRIGNLPVNTCQLLAVLIVTGLTYINSKGIKEGVKVQNLFTVTKIISMVLIIMFGFILGFNVDILRANLTTGINLPSGRFFEIISTALVGSSFASITWNNVTFIASEVKKPVRNIPKALLYGSILVIALYLVINFVFFGAIPLEMIKISPEDIVAAQLFNVIFGSVGIFAIAFIIVISAFGCANGMILTGARVYSKMAKDRLLFRRLAFVDRKTKVPVNSLYLQCFWICCLIFCGTYASLLDYVIYSSLIFYVLTILGIFKARKIITRKRGVFRVPNAVIFIFNVIAIFIIAGLTVYKPQNTLPGLLITLVGFPIYYFFSKTNKRKKFDTV